APRGPVERAAVRRGPRRRRRRRGRVLPPARRTRGVRPAARPRGPHPRPAPDVALGRGSRGHPRHRHHPRRPGQAVIAMRRPPRGDLPGPGPATEARPRRGGRRSAERAMVPEAEFRSYHGQPILKRPVWHEPDVPLALYLGGVSGASSTLAAAARATGRDRLALATRLAAALSGAAGSALLVAELGRPERFLNMLRVIKPTSPMSLGSWILAL